MSQMITDRNFPYLAFLSTPSLLTGDAKEEKGAILTQVHVFVDILITAIFCISKT